MGTTTVTVNGFVRAPGAPVTVGNIAVFDDTNGELIADGGSTLPIPVGQMVYVDQTYGSDSGPNIGLRGRFDRPFLTPEAAWAAATAGDLVHCGPGDYAVTDTLTKNGVSWYFEQGASVTMTNGSGNGIFDDNGVAIVCEVRGFGDFITLDDVSNFTRTYGTICTRNAASDIRVTCNSILGTCTEDEPGLNACVWGFDGKVYVNCNTMLGDYANCLYWENGDMFIDCPSIKAANIPAIATIASDTMTGKLWVNAQEIVQNGTNDASVIFMGGSEPNAQAWIQALEIRNDSDIGRALISDWSGKLYITAQKISGGVDSTAMWLSNGRSWITTEKFGGGSDMVRITGGEHYVTTQNFDADNATSIANISAGTLNLTGMLALSVADGIVISGGTAIINGLTIDTSASATSNPIVKSGGTLTLNNCTLIPEATRNAVEAATAQTVYSNGSTSAFDSHANVTFEGDFFYNDGTDADGNVATQNANGSWSWAAPAGGGGTWGSITGTLSDQTDLQAALDAKADKFPSVRTFTGTTDTLVIGDAGNTVNANCATACVITIPLNATVPFVARTRTEITWYGVGQPSIIPAGGATLNGGATAFKIAIRYGKCIIVREGTDEWTIDGNITT